MRLIVALMTALLVAASASAQPGPAPGYDSALEYAADYAEDQATQAGSDPGAYAENKTAPGAVDDEARHAAYMACWAADDAGFESQACDPYYTPRGEENPEQQCECNVSEDPEAFANATQENATAYAGNATHFVNETASDPANATSHAQSFVNATKAFAEAAVDRSVAFLRSIVDDVTTCLGIGQSIGISTASAMGSVFTLLGDVVQSGASFVADVGRAIGQGVVVATSSVGDGLAKAASATGDALVAAAKATGDAVQAVGSAVAEAAASLKDAVTGLFERDSAKNPTDTVGGAVDDVAGEDGLLDGVTRILPA